MLANLSLLTEREKFKPQVFLHRKIPCIFTLNHLVL